MEQEPPCDCLASEQVPLYEERASEPVLHDAEQVSALAQHDDDGAVQALALALHDDDAVQALALNDTQLVLELEHTNDVDTASSQSPRLQAHPFSLRYTSCCRL